MSSLSAYRESVRGEVVMVTEMKRWVSPVTEACEDAWQAIRVIYPDTPEAAILVAPRGRRATLGHYSPNRWASLPTKGEKAVYRPEVLIAAESINLGGEEVFHTILHEAVHGINWTNQVKDTDSTGRRHNRRYRAKAEEVGLVCEDHVTFGCVTIGLTTPTRKQFKDTIRRLSKTLAAHRRDQDARGKGVDRNYIRLMCECGRMIRISRKVSEEGPIRCGNCGTEFAEDE